MPISSIYAIAVAELDNDGDQNIVIGNRGYPGANFLNDGVGAARQLYALEMAKEPYSIRLQDHVFSYSAKRID